MKNFKTFYKEDKMKIKTISKSNLQIAEISKKNGQNADLLYADLLYVDANCTVAHDGSTLIRVTRPEMDTNETNYTGLKQKESAPFVIKSQDALQAAKTISSKKSHAIISQSNQDTNVKITSLEGPTISIDTIQEDYPDYKKVIPKNGIRIAFDVERMGIICKLAREFQKQKKGEYKLMYMDISDSDPSSPIKLQTRNHQTKQEFLAVLAQMEEAPIRENDE
ncbi:MAG: hypothetical protein ACE5GV_06010 [Candidatus Scalindua sp.]